MTAVLVVGASGQVGEHLCHEFTRRGADVVGTSCAQDVLGLTRLDLRDAAALAAVLEAVDPDVIVCPAAQPNVDLCEENPHATYEVNVMGLARLAEAARDRDTPLVWLSTDYLFDGTAGPYSEDVPARPIQEYGRQKLAGEHLLLAMLPTLSLIVRTNVVYGWERQGKNFVTRLIRTLGQGEPMRAPYDQFGTPTYAPNLAAMIADLVESGAHGVVNASGPDFVDRHTFAREAALAFGLDADAVASVSTPDLGQPAPRPLRAGLTTHRIEELITTKPMTIREGLQQMAETRQGRT